MEVFSFAFETGLQCLLMCLDELLLENLLFRYAGIFFAGKWFFLLSLVLVFVVDLNWGDQKGFQGTI